MFPNTMTPQSVPWWADRIVIPAIFVVAGAGIGLGVGQVKDWIESCRAKKAFLRAIRLELLGLEEQLQASLDAVEESKQKLQAGAPTPPELVGTLRNTVFTSQLGRISDLSDPLVIQIVKFYSDLGVLPQIIEALNKRSINLSKDDGIFQQTQRTRALLSTVMVLSDKLTGFLSRIRTLVAKLPSS